MSTFFLPSNHHRHIELTSRITPVPKFSKSAKRFLLQRATLPWETACHRHLFWDRQPRALYHPPAPNTPQYHALQAPSITMSLIHIIFHQNNYLPKTVLDAAHLKIVGNLEHYLTISQQLSLFKPSHKLLCAPLPHPNVIPKP